MSTVLVTPRSKFSRLKFGTTTVKVPDGAGWATAARGPSGAPPAVITRNSESAPNAAFLITTSLSLTRRKRRAYGRTARILRQGGRGVKAAYNATTRSDGCGPRVDCPRRARGECEPHVSPSMESVRNQDSHD